MADPQNVANQLAGPSGIQGNAAANLTCQIISNTNVQLKYKQTKIPYFFNK
jgi:hypothetical protein